MATRETFYGGCIFLVLSWPHVQFIVASHRTDGLLGCPLRWYWPAVIKISNQLSDYNSFARLSCTSTPTLMSQETLLMHLYRPDNNTERNYTYEIRLPIYYYALTARYSFRVERYLKVAKTIILFKK